VILQEPKADDHEARNGWHTARNIRKYNQEKLKKQEGIGGSAARNIWQHSQNSCTAI
jgi:hypothetical protein